MAAGKGNNSVKVVQQKILAGTLSCEPPVTVQLRTNLDRQLWDMYTSTRLATEWEHHELNKIGKLIFLETQIRKLRKMLKILVYLS